MASWGAEVVVECGTCGAAAAGRLGVGQFLREERLRWDAEFDCTACDAMMCLGFGDADTPDWVRGPLVERHGTVLLRLVEPSAGRVPVLRVLRTVWPLSLGEAGRVADLLAGPGLPATLPEAEWLRLLLAGRGAAAEVHPGTGAGRTAGEAASGWPWTLHS
ncbi:hypothetical protein [Kitasatospora sp. NPDC088134]|uniref:hypothetical protein n=1 Tax=Kitasatospora sp. NPDC088134 TaxID=3364071 RepID=UPI00382330A5